MVLVCLVVNSLIFPAVSSCVRLLPKGNTMYSVPLYISPRILFGSRQEIPITRIGAGREPSICTPSQETNTNIAVNTNLYLDDFIRFKSFKKSFPERDEIIARSNVLFYRRFLTKQQPCGICERPLSVYEFNAILPCAHIVHIGCYEEKVLNRRRCGRCAPMISKKGRVFDEIVKCCCCLYSYT
ncbi:hypothetical protein Q1695_004296 [Nippostrongylus brasiliensis]|nr:hypothetical protein Q1695_004296 [Nippostrongylus brasiliensis]